MLIYKDFSPTGLKKHSGDQAQRKFLCLHNDVASDVLSISNGPAIDHMLKSVGKLFASLSGNRSAGGITFHPLRTCPECGSKLCATERMGDPDALGSLHQQSEKDEGSCNPPLRNEDVVWHCPNPDCPMQIRAQLEHWCSRAAMDITGADARLVAKLVGAGLVRDVAELYRLKVAEVAGLEGMDRNSAQNFCNAIAASRKREAWRLLLGLDIPHVIGAAAQSLCRHFGSVDNVFAAGRERLSQAEGVSTEAAHSINHWYSDGVNRRLIKRLFKAGLNFKAG